MLQIDDQVLDSLGVIKDSDYRTYMSDSLTNLLSLRVANAVSALMSDEKLAEFDAVEDSRKTAWLEENIHDFDVIVKNELDESIAEIQRAMQKA